MSFTVRLTLRRAERALERALALAGRRGYELVAVSAAPTDDGRRFAVRLTVESKRPPEVLLHQLAKLYEVETVERVGPDPAAA